MIHSGISPVELMESMSFINHANLIFLALSQD